MLLGVCFDCTLAHQHSAARREREEAVECRGIWLEMVPFEGSVNLPERLLHGAPVLLSFGVGVVDGSHQILKGIPTQRR